MGKVRKILQYSPLLIIVYIGVLGLVYLRMPDIVFKVPVMPVFGNVLVILHSPNYRINYVGLLVFVPYIIASICSLWPWGKHRTVSLNFFSFLTLADAIAMICFIIVNSGIGQLAEEGVQYGTRSLIIFCVIELLLCAATNTLIWKRFEKGIKEKK